MNNTTQQTQPLVYDGSSYDLTPDALTAIVDYLKADQDLIDTIIEWHADPTDDDREIIEMGYQQLDREINDIIYAALIHLWPYSGVAEIDPDDGTPVLDPDDGLPLHYWPNTNDDDYYDWDEKYATKMVWNQDTNSVTDCEIWRPHCYQEIIANLEDMLRNQGRIDNNWSPHIDLHN